MPHEYPFGWLVGLLENQSAARVPKRLLLLITKVKTTRGRVLREVGMNALLPEGEGAI